MDDSTPDFTTNCDTSKNYNINGRIMLTSVLVCFTFCLIFLIFVLYYRSHNPRPENPTGHRFSQSLKPKGPSPFVIKSLPTFLYSSKTHDPTLECAVCLAEFQENQSGRVLPGCNHVFHVQCIDTWLASHSDCPLCRTTVRGNDPGTRPGNMHVTTGSSSAGPLCRNTVQSTDGYDPFTRPDKMPAITGSNSVGGSCSVPEVAIDIPMEEVDIDRVG